MNYCIINQCFRKIKDQKSGHKFWWVSNKCRSTTKNTFFSGCFCNSSHGSTSYYNKPSPLIFIIVKLPNRVWFTSVILSESFWEVLYAFLPLNIYLDEEKAKGRNLLWVTLSPFSHRAGVLLLTCHIKNRNVSFWSWFTSKVIKNSSWLYDSRHFC